MSILGHGIDLVEVQRIAAMVDRHGERFLERCFTGAERGYAESGARRRDERLAARFAAKEAVLKALGTGWRDGIAWTDVEVVREPSGRPAVRLHGAARRIADGMGVAEWWLSLTHTEGHAMASVIAVGGGAMRAERAKVGATTVRAIHQRKEPRMSHIAIIGGHGKVALELSRILIGAGHEVTSLFRNPDHSDEVGETGATPVVLDVEERSTGEIAERIRGHDVVVWSAGAGGGNPTRTFAVDRDAAIRSMDAAERAGVLRYVMVSYLGSSTEHGVAEDNPFFAYAESKAAADRYLRGTGLSWTILGPGRLTQEKASGRIELDPDKDAARRDTSRGNVARVAAAALADSGSIGKTINFVDGETPIEEAVGAAK